MGREWLYKATGGGDGSGRSRDGGKSPSAAATGLINGKKAKYKNTSSSGCMSAIYNQFRFQHPSFMSSESAITDNFCLQGIEAPRNSLESPESAMKVSHSSSKVIEQTNLNIPVGRIQIKTNRSKFTDDLCSECCSSPGTKTPNIVARLMGLDLLPEYSSPRASSSSATANSHHRSHSLPVTPRLSTASRRSTDNDYHHRLSLQIDKENHNESLHMKMKNETRERISRRLGTDITNTMSPARGKCHRRDSNIVLLKPKKSLTTETTGKAKRDESKHFSSSPKLRLLDIKSNLNKPISNSTKSQMPYFRETPAMKPENLVKYEKIKRITSERYDLRLMKKSQQEKVFVSKKKSTALPKQGLNVNNTKKFQSFKKAMTSSSSTTTKSSQKQVSLPSNLNSSYNSNDTHNLKAAAAAAATTFAADNSCIFSDCEVFERDMRRLLSTAFVAEVEDITVEIECEILENLVQETATEMVAPAGSDRLRPHVMIT